MTILDGISFLAGTPSMWSYKVVNGETLLDCTEATGLTARAVNHETYRYNRTFRGCFGVAPHLAAELWNMLDDADPMSDIRWVTYFLATLMFLRTYTVTPVLAMIFMKDEKTIRHWVWVFIEKLATLDLVRQAPFIHRRLQFKELTMYMLHSSTTAAPDPDQMGEQTDE
ncbi:unknown protein [Seminavis robusta]|uniref:Uncharacterized protein n=1 Tax=Seminavis robusta TaxID=568900 RepID=A0A9N8EJG8_9STRA|nr:unknown protein [Seminavis robusta]|eukprot:Sro1031_g233500.1 n/a (169) ;mRNA; r:35919-36561